jgi:hypothetical protein
MSHEHYKRGRNWYTAIGSLFIIMAGIVLVRQTILWSPEFVQDFIFNSEFTSEKVSIGMITFGVFMILVGFKKNESSK